MLSDAVQQRVLSRVHGEAFFVRLICSIFSAGLLIVFVLICLNSPRHFPDLQRLIEIDATPFLAVYGFIIVWWGLTILAQFRAAWMDVGSSGFVRRVYKQMFVHHLDDALSSSSPLTADYSQPRKAKRKNKRDIPATENSLFATVFSSDEEVYDYLAQAVEEAKAQFRKRLFQLNVVSFVISIVLLFFASGYFRDLAQRYELDALEIGAGSVGLAMPLLVGWLMTLLLHWLASSRFSLRVLQRVALTQLVDEGIHIPMPRIEPPQHNLRYRLTYDGEIVPVEEAVNDAPTLKQDQL